MFVGLACGVGVCRRVGRWARAYLSVRGCTPLLHQVGLLSWPFNITHFVHFVHFFDLRLFTPSQKRNQDSGIARGPPQAGLTGKTTAQSKPQGPKSDAPDGRSFCPNISLPRFLYYCGCGLLAALADRSVPWFSFVLWSQFHKN